MIFDNLEREFGIKLEDLTPKQKECLDILDHVNIGIMNGGPGTGKSTTVRFILQKYCNLSIRVATPTGRASKRFFECTNFPASTIHSLLAGFYADGKFIFRHNKDNPLPCDLLIIDEAGMIDFSLMKSLFTAIDTSQRHNGVPTKVLFVGDLDQLLPVGPGSPFRDMIESEVVKIVTLDKPQRFMGSIVEACHQIKKGEIYTPDNKLDIESGHNLRHIEIRNVDGIYDTLGMILTEYIPEKLNLDPIWDTQILGITNDKGDLSCKDMNEYMQDKLNSIGMEIRKSPFRIGDKIIQTQNDVYPSTGLSSQKVSVVNGDIGKIFDVSNDGKKLVVNFYDPQREVFIPVNKNDLKLSYACTVWKYQGSEVPIVIFPVFPYMSFNMTRELVYTAISRASVCCITIGSFKTLRKAVMKNQVRRKTFLKEKIKKECECVEIEEVGLEENVGVEEIDLDNI